MNVLFVDDEIAVLNILKKSIDWNEINIEHVYEAYNTKEARKIIAQEEIHIIVCDIEMPQESGLEFLAWIQKFYPNIVNIILTGYPDFSYAKEAVNIGIYKFLLKPVIYNELRQVVESAVFKVKETKRKESQIKYGEYCESKWMNNEKQFLNDLLSEEIPPIEGCIQSETKKRCIQDLKIKVMLYFNLYDICIKDENILYFSLVNIAEELYKNIIVIHINNGIIWIIKSVEEHETIEKMCNIYLYKVKLFMKCEMDAYVSYNIALQDFANYYRRVRQIAGQFHKKGEHIYFEEDWANQYSLRKEDMQTKDYDIVQKVKAYLEKNYSESVNRTLIEELFHLNQDYLNRIFKKSTGYTLMEYIQYCRVKRAKQLLDDTSMTIGEICGEVGYDSPAYFSKIFKKWSNLTPIEFRNR